MTELPDRYAKLLSEIKTREVSYGAGGIRLFEPSEILQEQSNYSMRANPKDWQSKWVVIGHDTGLGDPLILEANHPKLQVFTTILGEWNLPSNCNLD